jgi:hypothetical protein
MNEHGTMVTAVPLERMNRPDGNGDGGKDKRETAEEPRSGASS